MRMILYEYMNSLQNMECYNMNNKTSCITNNVYQNKSNK